MNIGIFTDTFRPRVNGVTVSVETFANEFEKAGHNVFIFAPRFPDYIDKRFKVIRVPSHKVPFDPEDRIANPFLVETRLLLDRIRSLKLDVIHTQTPFTLGFEGLIYGKYLGIPVVHTYHTLFVSYVHYLWFIPEFVSTSLAKTLSRIYCNQCDFIIVPSLEMKKELLSYGVSKPIDVIPTGIKDGFFNKGDGISFRKNFGIPEDKRILLYIGRIGKEKNIPFLINVFEKLSKKYSDIILIIGGKGPEEGNIRRLVETKRLKEKVFFVGYLNFEKLINCYASSYIFVFSSITETQGLVLLEAMAQGKPVVAIGRRGVVDVLRDGKGGFLVEPDENEFLEKLELLLEDEKAYNEKSEEARERAKEFSAEKMAKKEIEIYNSLIRKIF
uniref:Glycosyltransferase family 4 protein n=1 Tax=candidate division WOR-3 bacterium TaxID=2052148 RepID=A0A7C4YAM6_UNCW3